ncbi:MAG: hypothetical protein IPK34_10025 [Ramlibacter sp.]|jgi:hypothetical protein|nr:hypothetical protein [Ramlibacter sp.]
MTITCFIRCEIDPFQHEQRFMLREPQTFLRAVDGTLNAPAQRVAQLAAQAVAP